MKTLTFTQAFKRKYPQYKYVLKHIKAYNNDKDANWSDFKKLFLINLVQYFQNVVSPNSARLYCAYLKSLFNDYSDEVQLPCKEYNYILSLKKVGSTHTWLTPCELELIENFDCKGDKKYLTVQKLFLIASYTGMRYSDVSAIDELNVINGYIQYVSKKTAIEAHIPAKPIVLDLLTRPSIEVNSVDFNFIIKDICKKVGISQQVKLYQAGRTVVGEKWEFVTSHTSRRTFASNLVLAGVDLYSISKMLGHSSIEQLSTYIVCPYNRDRINEVSYFH